MSADIWLEIDGEQITVTDGYDEAMRDLVPMRYAGEVTATTFNLTYNLSRMLREAGMPLWRDMLGMRAPEAGGIWHRVHDTLVEFPDRFRAMNPPNGWGTYEDAVNVIGALARACDLYPDAKVAGWL
jgi:hypothetical protein